MSEVTNLTKLVEDKRKAEVVEMLQSAMDRVQENGASDVLILLKSDGVYTRFSTKMDNVMEVVAQLELLKYDVLRRMHD
jgi:DNA topoisomerase VI subunit B